MLAMMSGGRRVFVISDLHLGGRPKDSESLGFQICSAQTELVQFVEWVRKLEDPRDRELVINGDVIDFLAEDESCEWTLTDHEAVAKFDNVVDGTRVAREEDGRHIGFFDALAALLREGHRVTFLLGNHDVELSLPAVRRRLEEVLGPGRLRMVYDGEAYTVGRVLIEHGNRYDPWNVVNFDGLREERSVRSRGFEIKPEHDRYFHPPTGTLLVTNIMNPLKRRYRFIDLLKPETGAVIPLLLALEPTLNLPLRALLKIAPLVYTKHHDHDGMPVRSGELGGVSDDAVDLDAILRGVLREHAADFADADASKRIGELGGIGDLLLELRGYASKLREMTASVAALAAIKLAPTADSRRKRLLAALNTTAGKDRSFDPGHAKDGYQLAAETICKTGAFDVVVFGHTHLPKQIDLKEAVGRSATYLNTGTWADVIRLDRLAPPIDVSFINAVAANQLEPYITRYLTYADIEITGERVTSARIRSFCGKDHPSEPPLTAHDVSR